MNAILIRTMVALRWPARVSAVLALSLVTTGCAAPAERAVVALDGIEIRVEIAEKPGDRSRGLQGHEPLAPGEGMLFVFEDAGVRTFAMKEVTFPIDVVFIGQDLTVSAIEPLSPGESRLAISPGPSAYVVELPQGWAAGLGIGVGSEFVPPE
ncbi:MAG: DUF192 domain-containing protein [Coriobacteriia bacterium]|nr:DUF192 domain-containing protein [Actinomycetota bacterium]MDZ4166898.1 DUF192 domain-containing protein [Coriobacteriia bacterium]